MHTIHSKHPNSETNLQIILTFSPTRESNPRPDTQKPPTLLRRQRGTHNEFEVDLQQTGSQG